MPCTFGCLREYGGFCLVNMWFLNCNCHYSLQKDGMADIIVHTFSRPTLDYSNKRYENKKGEHSWDLLHLEETP